MDKIFIKEIVNPICYIFIGIAVYFLLKKIIFASLKIKVKGENGRKKKTIINLISNIMKYTITAIVILMILEVYNVNTGAIFASLGVVSVVIGLALQDLIKDLIAGIAIIFDDQYSIGDSVTVNGFRGKVISLGLRSTKVKSADGDILTITNGKIEEVINHSVSNSFAKVEVDVAYEENLDHVLEVLNKLCREFEKEEKNLKGPLEVLGVNDLGESGIRILIRGETVPEGHFGIQRELRKRIKDRFDKEGISIPYPQITVHNGK